MRMLIGDHLVFSVPPLVIDLFPGYFQFFAFGVVMGALGGGFSRMVVAGLTSQTICARSRRNFRQRLSAGGWSVGIRLATYDRRRRVAGAGNSGRWPPIRYDWTPFVVRLVLGPLCYAPGLPGGLFAPLLVIGAAAGLLFGMGSQTLIPMSTAAAGGVCRGWHGRTVRRGRGCAGDWRCAGESK